MVESQPCVLRTISGIREVIARERRNQRSVGLVPTMGALHKGHLALVETARTECDVVVVSIFVNPLQFGQGEDYETYPRDEQRDIREAAASGADVFFCPDIVEMFPDGRATLEEFSTVIHVGGLTETLCGLFRPGHFDGVAVEVCKTLMIVVPDVAYLGEKDFQQLQIVRRMVDDLSIPVSIRGVATVREADGLALSSRNQYLTPAEREIAPCLYRTLTELTDHLSGSVQGLGWKLMAARDSLLEAGFKTVDYIEAVDASSLREVTDLTRPARVAGAAWLGRARLIDNVPLMPNPGRS